MFWRKNLMLTGLLFLLFTFPTLLGRKEVTFIIFKFFLQSLTLMFHQTEKVKELPLQRRDEHFTSRMADFSICSSILHSP